jgi:uncharacterized membrane protein YdjX (TVP38/TMEM64 family)
VSPGGRWRLAGIALALVAAGLAIRVLPVAEIALALQRRVADLGFWGMALYAAVYVIAALLFVPGSILTLGAGLAFGFVKGTVVVLVAAVLAAALAFLIARHWARPWVERHAARHPRFAAIDRAIQQRGARVVLLLRLSPLVPFSLSNYLYGLTAVRFAPYVLASAVGMAPATAVYVYLGSAGRALGEARSPAEWALFVGGLAATVAVTVLVGRAAKKEMARVGD